MGVKERQERDRETVARAILDAARHLFVTHGYHEVSIRKIAERIEYSPAAIYGYFPSKDDIFFALAEEGFRLLFQYGGTPRPVSDDPAETLRAMFLRYYEFSKEHPEYFALMFLDRSVPRISRDWERFGFVSEMKHDMVGAHPAGDRRRRLPGRYPAADGLPAAAHRRRTAPRRCACAIDSRPARTPMSWRAPPSTPCSSACRQGRAATSIFRSAFIATVRTSRHDSFAS